MRTSYIGKTFPYCQFPIKADSEVVECRACKVPHHKECWTENGGCTTFGCREKSYQPAAATDRLEVSFDELTGRGFSPARGGGNNKLLVAALGITLLSFAGVVFAYINLLSYSVGPPQTYTYALDEAKRKEIVDFMERATSNFEDFLPEFSDPNEIRNDDLIFILLFNGITTSYWNEDDYITRFKGTDVQQAARKIFGPNVKDIVHSSVDFADWQNQDQEYHVHPFGPMSSTENHVLDIMEEPDIIIVDVVHLLYYYYGDYARIDETDVFDEYGNLVVVLKKNELFDKAYLADLPVRRYILKKTNDRGFYITKSFRM